MSAASRKANRESARRANNTKTMKQVSNNNTYFSTVNAKKEKVERIKKGLLNT